METAKIKKELEDLQAKIKWNWEVGPKEVIKIIDLFNEHLTSLADEKGE
jgi:hypothetical protein